MSVRLALALLVCGLLPPASLVAQRPGGADQMRRQLQTRFESTSPNVGDRLPDVSLFDAEGKPFHLRNLKGDYTVLVFGCLT